MYGNVGSLCSALIACALQYPLAGALVLGLGLGAGAVYLDSSEEPTAAQRTHIARCLVEKGVPVAEAWRLTHGGNLPQCRFISKEQQK